MGSLQPKNQVADKRDEPDQDGAADSSMVSGFLMILLCLWMFRMRISLNNGRTASTFGTSVETISVQSSPPESPVMSPRGEAATPSVRVSNAAPFPPAQTVRYRRHVNVTPIVPQETLVSCFHRSGQLLPGSNAVSVYLTCLGCRHHTKWTQRTGPTLQVLSCNECFRRGGQHCNDGKDDVSVCADGVSNVVSGSGCACASC